MTVNITEIIADLNSIIKDAKTQSLEGDQLKKVITQKLRETFNGCTRAESNALYRELAEKFHSNNLQETFPENFSNLGDVDPLSILMEALSDQTVERLKIIITRFHQQHEKLLPQTKSVELNKEKSEKERKKIISLLQNEIQACLKRAYNLTESEEARKKLFNALSLELQSEKFDSQFTPEEATFLVASGLKNDLQRINKKLDETKTQLKAGSFNALINEIGTILPVYWQFVRNEMRTRKSYDETQDIAENLEYASKTLTRYIPGVSFIFKQTSAIDDYIQPFKFLASFFYFLTIGSMLVTYLVAILPLLLVLKITKGLQYLCHKLLNLVSIDYINKEIFQESEKIIAQQKEENQSEQQANQVVNLSWFQGKKAILLGLLKSVIHFFPPSDKKLSWWKKGLYIVFWPIRLLLAIPLLALYGVSEIALWLNLIPVIVLAASLVFVAAVMPFLLNLPRYVITSPYHLWVNRKAVGEFLYDNRYTFLRSLLFTATTVALTFATFGVAPILLGVSAGVGLLSSLVFDKITFLKNPYVQAVFMGLLLVAAAAAVMLTYGGATPVIVTLLPFAIPEVLSIKLLMVAVGSFLVSTLPSVANLAITSFANIFSQPKMEIPKPESTRHKIPIDHIKMTCYAIAQKPDENHAYTRIILRTKERAEGFLQFARQQCPDDEVLQSNLMTIIPVKLIKSGEKGHRQYYAIDSNNRSCFFNKEILKAPVQQSSEVQVPAEKTYKIYELARGS